MFSGGFFFVAHRHRFLLHQTQMVFTGPVKLLAVFVNIGYRFLLAHGSKVLIPVMNIHYLIQCFFYQLVVCPAIQISCHNIFFTSLNRSSFDKS